MSAYTILYSVPRIELEWSLQSKEDVSVAIAKVDVVGKVDIEVFTPLKRFG
jgi:hypothetical protein